MTTTPTTRAARPVRLRESDCDIDDFTAVVSATTDVSDYPHADRVEQGVLIYDSAALRAAGASPEGVVEVEGELARALSDGPGIVVLEGAFPDHEVVDRVTAVFDEIIDDERAAGTAPGDHFAKPGANSRVWNALKRCCAKTGPANGGWFPISLAWRWTRWRCALVWPHACRTTWSPPRWWWWRSGR